ncbi:hypothetical protein CcCBS67573_g01175 [Chytriomyces confervae]|uniref:C2H2-type domain-containing protein n=1 Tax=Chytriomyces confervae TaxID=246404 RepID=A0A507FMR4_9FUNG|nr:hypothetical protein HDU80_004811 [Chytriomyces hyalinus]TPX77542.1 hypothetical protein CcCBS67573_g01175 [Chytriomyces confervae]
MSSQLPFKSFNAMLDQLAFQALNHSRGTELSDELSPEPYDPMAAEFPVDIDPTFQVMQQLHFAAMPDISFINDPMVPVMNPMAAFQPPFMPDYSLGMAAGMMPPAEGATAHEFASQQPNLLFPLDLEMPMLQEFSSMAESAVLDPVVNSGTGTFEVMDGMIAASLWSLEMVQSPFADEPPSPTASHCASSPLSMSSATAWGPTASIPLPFVFNSVPNPTSKRTQILNNAPPGRHPCPIDGCTSSLKSSASCRQHIISHTREKPFICQQDGCGKAYTTNNRLKVHTRCHSKEKPYKCNEPGCSYAGTQACSLNAHKQTHMSKEARAEYKRTHAPTLICETCGRLYRSDASLKQHIRVHH